jgi:S-phase kinase-associated protein 1
MECAASYLTMATAADTKTVEKKTAADDGKKMKIPAKVTLTSTEGECFEVTGKIACMSELVKTMIATDDDAGDDESGGSSEAEDHEIPLPNVKAEVLAKVIEFCTKHVDEPMQPIEKPLKSAKMEQVVGKWDAKFVDIEQELLFELILAANYMDIKSLLDLTCAKVASMIKGKTPEQIRKTFNIVNDFTPEEEAKVREENKWCEES